MEARRPDVCFQYRGKAGEKFVIEECVGLVSAGLRAMMGGLFQPGVPVNLISGQAVYSRSE